MKIKQIIVFIIFFLFSIDVVADVLDTCASKLSSDDYSGALYYCENACKQNNAEGCNYLGLIYYNDVVVKQDYQKAKVYFEKSCNLNEGIGCYNLGWLYQNAQGVRQDYQQAKVYYEKSCNLNEGLGCNNLGWLYQNAQGVRQDYQQAKVYYEKSCNLNISEGCSNLGNLFYEGRGVKSDNQQAKLYFDRACELGDKEFCQVKLPEKYDHEKHTSIVWTNILLILVIALAYYFRYHWIFIFRKKRDETIVDDNWSYKLKTKANIRDNTTANSSDPKNDNSNSKNKSFTNENTDGDGVTSSKRSREDFFKQEELIQNLYTETFAIAGYVARGNGVITTAQIEIVTKTIDSLCVTEKERKSYQNKFNNGKQNDFSPNFSCRFILSKLKQDTKRDSTISFIYDFWLSLVFVDNQKFNNDLSRIWTISRLLELSDSYVNSIINNYISKYNLNEDNVEKKEQKENSQEEQILNIYTEIFALAGYVARGQGKISKEQIDIVSNIIDSIGGTKKERQCYQNKFNEGKKENFNPKLSCFFISALLSDADDEKKIAIIVYILDLFLPIVFADGILSDEELSRILTVTQLLGLPDELVQSFIYEYENRQSQSESVKQNDVNRAFSVLGLTSDATFEDVKVAYKRLIKKYHPDRVRMLGLSKEQEEKEIKNYTKRTQEITEAYAILKQYFEK